MMGAGIVRVPLREWVHGGNAVHPLAYPAAVQAGPFFT